MIPGLVTSRDIDEYRVWLRTYQYRQPQLAEQARRSNAELREAIDGAINWIEGRRQSWHTVAANYLIDGTYHL